MVDRMDPLPVNQQCALLELPRSTYYHIPKAVSDEELELMRLIDRCHLEHPFYGSRRIRDWLGDEGYRVNRKRIQRMMRTMGLVALYPKRNLSLANQTHKVYPYLLRNLEIERPNQVWATDITYIPMAKGFVYLVAIMDRYSRWVLSWRVSNTLETSFCVEALDEAIETYGVPEIFNTDQGSQFTSEEFTGVLKRHDIQISMGWQRPLGRQRLRGTLVAQCQVRGGLSQGLRKYRQCSCLVRKVFCVLQHQASTSVA